MNFVNHGNYINSAVKERCECGKICFDKKTAQTKANSLKKHGKGQMRIYQCDQSDWWHLTHKQVIWGRK